MAFEFKLPELGEGLAEGEIVKWDVKPGDDIKEYTPCLKFKVIKVSRKFLHRFQEKF